METLPVTLIVKAPNQQIEDQRIECELSWTIHKLKQHLSEVYPSKPPKHEQKLIYSGQLLNDSSTLKDVLRQFEGQEVHTVHLVCTTKYTKPEEKTPLNNTNSGNPAPTAQTEFQSSQANSRNENMVPDENPYNNMPWINANGPQATPADVNQYAMQLAWMQQAYYQYMTQYMQFAANSYGTPTPPSAVPGATPPVPGDAPGAVPPQPQNPAAPQPDQPPAPLADGIRDNPDHPERDWLDVFYVISRAIILFSVVYFYSSPLRFIFVLILGISFYLYQIGLFRTININNNNNNTRDPAEVEEEQAPSRLMIVWTFFATFFASLIPEIPNAI
nr:unnamed protein product [Callosobruchus chinensis]